MQPYSDWAVESPPSNPYRDVRQVRLSHSEWLSSCRLIAVLVIFRMWGSESFAHRAERLWCRRASRMVSVFLCTRVITCISYLVSPRRGPDHNSKSRYICMPGSCNQVEAPLVSKVGSRGPPAQSRTFVWTRCCSVWHGMYTTRRRRCVR